MLATPRHNARPADAIGTQSPSPESEAQRGEDQTLLDEILRVMSRRAMRVVRENDFAEPWPVTLTSPFELFYREYQEVEHRFHDPSLEAARLELREVAGEFIGAEAMNGWLFDRDPGHRFVGMTGGEVEGDPEAYKRFDHPQRTSSCKRGRPRRCMPRLRAGRRVVLLHRQRRHAI